jgi:hypothetical protein
MQTQSIKNLLLLSLLANASPYAFSASNRPPPTCDGANSQCTIDCFEYSYAQTTAATCPVNTDKLLVQNVVIPPVVIDCQEAGIGQLACFAEPEGLTIPVTYNWSTTTPGASVQNGHVRCNAGLPVIVTVDVSNGYDTQSADLTMTCTDFNN